MKPKPQGTDGKNVSWSSSKFNLFMLQESEKPQTERKSLQYTHDKELLPKIYKGLLKLNSKKTQLKNEQI